MSPSHAKSWICTVCGYVHQGPEPPDVCPVCGAGKEMFELQELEPEPPAQKTIQWQCLNCNYVHNGPEPPQSCPVCGVSANNFKGIQEDKSALQSHDAPVRIVIAGAGIAGLSAAEAARKGSRAAHITLISREKTLPYYRLNLTRYLAGESGPETLPIHPESWFKSNNINLLSGVDLASITPGNKKVTLSDGKSLEYDKLILTTGSHAFMPPFAQTPLKGLTALRTISHAEAILQSATAGKKVICIGGGILGLEAAGALAKRGADVTLLEGHAWLLPRQLNRQAGELLGRYAEQAGLKLLPEVKIKSIQGTVRVEKVLLGDGSALDADLVIVAAGVRSNTCVARQAKLTVNRGVVVSDTLHTSHPDILAAGDLAEHRGLVYGTWQPSQYMGTIAGANALGQAMAFGGIPRSNVLKVLGVDMISLGDIHPEDASFTQMEETREGRYCWFSFRDNRLRGAILVGHAGLANPVRQTLEKQTELSALLLKNPGASEVLSYFSRL